MDTYAEAATRSVTLLVGCLFAIVFIVFGLLIERYKHYNLIAGYNRASKSVQARYDIEALAKHVGNGLETLGVLMFIAMLFSYFELDGWFVATIAIFIFIALIIPIGARKFMPARRQLMVDSPADAMHPFLYWVLPTKAYKSLERETRQWLIECGACEHKRDYWEAGGVRSGGFGEPRKWFPCPACNGFHWHKIRKKTRTERMCCEGIPRVAR